MEVFVSYNPAFRISSASDKNQYFLGTLIKEF